MSKEKKLPSGIDRVSGGYRARISVDSTQHYLGTYPALQDAKTALAIAWGQKAAGTFIPPRERKRQLEALKEKERREAITARQWAGVWLEGLTTADTPRSAGTIRSYSSTLNAHILPEIGDMNLKEITPEDIDVTIETARMKTGKPRPAVARNVARTLRAMFSAALAAEVGGLEESPVNVTITQPQARTERIQDRTATPAQVRELAALMPKPLALAVMLGAWAALRQGEVLGLQRQDFSGLTTDDNARVKVQRQWHSKLSPPAYAPPKRGSERTIHLPASIAALVKHHLNRYVDKDPAAPLFPGAQNRARPYSQSAFDRHWRTARDKVKPGLRFHDLRHTGLTYYAQQGATLKELMARGGHSDMKVALMYQDAAAERDRTLTAKLDAAIAGEPE